ncbi:hypothetical protein Tco_0600818 [Tanacetum coccineum]
MRNTLGKEPVLQDPGRPISNEALREYCDKNYHQILPIIAEKVHKEKVQQEKLKVVKAHLNFEETSHHSESGTPTGKRGLKERLGPRHVRSRSGSPEPRRGRSDSPKQKGSERKMVFKRLEKGTLKTATKVPDQDQRSPLQRDVITKGHPREERRSCQKARVAPEILSLLGFVTLIPKTRMPSHTKTYDGSEDLEDHLKIFQSAAKTKQWAMPTCCHMFNSTLTGNARKKCIKDPVEIHNIGQRDEEATEEFVRRYKLECRDVKGAPECMKIFGFMHGITNLELIKRLHDKIPKSLDEMMRVTTAFLWGEVAASNRERKKSFLSWKQHEANQKKIFKKGGFWNQQRSERKQDRFALLTKTPKEIFALDKGKFKAPPPMTTPV